MPRSKSAPGTGPTGAAFSDLGRDGPLGGPSGGPIGGPSGTANHLPSI
jgi:hypothetical protein